MATRCQFELKIAIRLVAIPLDTATASATHLKIQLCNMFYIFRHSAGYQVEQGASNATAGNEFIITWILHQIIM